MKTLTFSPSAQNDIDSIHDYTSQTWGLAQAERYVGQVRDACYELRDGRQIGQDICHVREGYLRLRCGSHFIYYRESASHITVQRILHQRMDLARHL
jgi:toxin ParE1/3/4